MLISTRHSVPEQLSKVKTAQFKKNVGCAFNLVLYSALLSTLSYTQSVVFRCQVTTFIIDTFQYTVPIITALPGGL